MSHDLFFVLMWFMTVTGWVLLACGINSMIATQRTLFDRLSIVTAAAFRFRTGPEVLNGLHAVKWKRHMRARFFWQNPWKLYPEIVQHAIANPSFAEPPEIKVHVGGAVLVPVEEDEKGPTLQ